MSELGVFKSDIVVPSARPQVCGIFLLSVPPSRMVGNRVREADVCFNYIDVFRKNLAFLIPASSLMTFAIRFLLNGARIPVSRQQGDLDMENVTDQA